MRQRVAAGAGKDSPNVPLFARDLPHRPYAAATTGVRLSRSAHGEERTEGAGSAPPTPGALPLPGAKERRDSEHHRVISRGAKGALLWAGGPGVRETFHRSGPRHQRGTRVSVGSAAYGPGMAPKRPNPKKDKSARRRRPQRPMPGTFTAGVLDPNYRARVDKLSMQATSAPPEALIPVLLATTWAGVQVGQTANHCVDACRTLGFALAQLGIRTELRAAELIIRNNRTGQMSERAPRIPSWQGNELTGHCILTLPEQDRFIDATIEQFHEVAALKLGPAVGRAGAFLDPDTGAVHAPRATAARPVAGSVLALQRGNLVLAYTLSPDHANDIITSHPVVTATTEGHRRAGINLVSLVLGHLRGRGLDEVVRRAPFPRLHTLLDAIADSPVVDDNGEVRFTITRDGQQRDLLLDELPLPADAPPEAPVS